MRVYTVGYLIFYVEFVQIGNIFRIVLSYQYRWRLDIRTNKLFMEVIQKMCSFVLMSEK